MHVKRAIFNQGCLIEESEHVKNRKGRKNVETDLPLVCFTFLVRTDKDVASVLPFTHLAIYFSKLCTLV